MIKYKYTVRVEPRQQSNRSLFDYGKSSSSTMTFIWSEEEFNRAKEIYDRHDTELIVLSRIPAVISV